MKRPTARVTIRIAALLIFAGVIVLAVGPVRAELERRITELKVQTVDRLEHIIGRQISYSSISPSILRSLSVNDLTIHGLADEPADLVTVSRLRVYYRPLYLITGRLSEAFSEIRIENTTLSIDTTRDSDLVAIMSDIAGTREARGFQTLVPNGLTLSGRNIDLKVASDLGIVGVRKLFFTSTATDDVLTFRSQGSAEFLPTSVGLGINELAGDILAAGTVNLRSGNALLDVTLPKLESDVARMERQVFQVSYDGTIVEARKIRDRNPVDLYLRFQPDPVELYARILSDGYRLSDLVHLEGPYATFNRYIELPIRGQASATVTREGISYTGSLLTTVSRLPIPDGEITVQFSGDTTRMAIDRLDYHSVAGDLGYEGTVGLSPFRPDGRVALRDVVYGGIAPLSVTGQVQSAGDAIRVDTNRFTYAGVHLSGISGFLTAGDAPVAEATLTIAGAPEGRLDVATELDGSGAVRRLTVDARSVLPSELEHLQQAVLPNLRVPDLGFLPDTLVVSTRLSADLTGAPAIEVPVFTARDLGKPGDSASFSLRYSDERIEVSEAEVTYDGYHGTGEFAADFDQSGSIAFSSDVVVEGIPYQFSGTYDPENSFVIHGLHDVDARIDFGSRGEVIFAATGNIPVPIAVGTDSRVGFDASGYVLSPSDWAVSVAELSVSGVPYYAVDAADLRISGDFGPDGGEVSRLGYSDAFSSLTGAGSVRWNIPDRKGSLNLVLTDGSGQETYTGTARYDGSGIGVSAVFTRLPLLRLGVTAVRGALSGSVDLSGPPDGITARVAATLNEGRFNGDLVELSAVVDADPERVAVSELSAKYVRTALSDVSGEISLVDHRGSLEGTVTQPGESGNVVVGVSLLGDFDTTAPTFARMLAGNFTARALVTGLPVKNDLPEDWQFALDRSEGTLTVAGGPEDALSGELRPDGTFDVSLSPLLPLGFDAVGRFDGGDVEADLVNVSADIARLWRIVDSPGVSFVGGTATGSVRIVGPLNDPDFYGTLIADNVTGTIDIVPDLVGPTRAYLVFNQKVLTVREAQAPVGNGRVRLSSAITLDRWLPDEYRLWADTVEGSPIRVINDFGGVAIDGLAAGSVVVSGNAERVLVEGSTVASAMKITLSEVPEPTDVSGEPGDFLVDMQVKTGRGVEFLWPTDAFPILRGIADAGESVHITHQRSTNSYTVDGAVNIRGGEVFYFDRSFYIKQGRMIFAEDQSHFDPLLTVNAEIREVGPDGPIRIYLVADERPLSAFTPQWRSDPPLPEAEIIALLGGNVFVASDGTPLNLSQALLLTSDLVSQFGLIRGFETTIRDTLQLDLFSIRTQLFQNLIRGVLDQAAYPLDTGAPSLGKYLDNTTLFLGKYLGTDLFLELLVQLRATDQAEADTRTLAGIAVDSEFSLEWQTPFFLLDWSFFPTDPSSLFLRDNTFSFAWEYRY